MLGTFDVSPLPNNIPSPMTSHGQSTPEPASEGETVVSHVQYNTPIGLYSNDNVMEAFEGQTGGLVIVQQPSRHFYLNLAKIPPNQVIADFGRGSIVESESE